MSNTSITIFILFIALWLYTVYSIFSSEFKSQEAKIFWRIGIVFVPFLTFFYLFFKKDLLSMDNETDAQPH